LFNFLPYTQEQVPELFQEALSHKKIPQEVPVAVDRAFLPGAPSVRVTPAKARGYGRFSVTHREGRMKECRRLRAPATDARKEKKGHGYFIRKNRKRTPVHYFIPLFVCAQEQVTERDQVNKIRLTPIDVDPDYCL